MRHTTALIALLAAGVPMQAYAQAIGPNTVIIFDDPSPEEEKLKEEAIARLPLIGQEMVVLEGQADAALKACDKSTVQSVLREMRTLGDEYYSQYENQFIGEQAPTAPDFNPAMAMHEIADGVAYELEKTCGAKERNADSGVDVYVTGAFGQTNFGTTAAGIGFQSTGPGTETFAATMPTKIDAFSVKTGFDFPLSEAANIFGSYGYSEGDGRQDFDIVAGGPVDVGFVYGEFSPSGSTGLNVGNRGVSGFTEIAHRLHELKMGVGTNIGESNEFGAAAAVFVNLMFNDVQTTSQAQSTVFGSVLEQTRDQGTSNNYYGLGGKLSFKQGIGPGVALNGAVTGGIYYRDSDLRSTEWNDCALCPAADQNFTIAIDDQDSGTAFAGTVSGGIEFAASERLSIDLSGFMRYLSDVGTPSNPSSGDQVLDGETTRLTTTSVYEWRAAVGARLRF